MTTLETTVAVGPDGRLRLDLPADAGEYTVRVTRNPPAPKPPSEWAGPTPTPEELGWPPGHFERLAGSIPDFSIEPRNGGNCELCGKPEGDR